MQTNPAATSQQKLEEWENSRGFRAPVCTDCSRLAHSKPVMFAIQKSETKQAWNIPIRKYEQPDGEEMFFTHRHLNWLFLKCVL